jgi:four helix bundle protein
MNTLNRAKRLQNRTKKIAVRIIKPFARLPKDEATRIIGRQFLRSGTSLAANYRGELSGTFHRRLHLQNKRGD